MTEEQMNAVFAEYMTYSKEMALAGVMKGGASLHPTMTATTVRVKNDKAIGRFKFTHLGRHGPGERRGVSPTWIRGLPRSGATTSGLHLDARLAAAWVNLFLPLA